MKSEFKSPLRCNFRNQEKQPTSPFGFCPADTRFTPSLLRASSACQWGKLLLNHTDIAGHAPAAPRADDPQLCIRGAGQAPVFQATHLLRFVRRTDVRRVVSGAVSRAVPIAEACRAVRRQSLGEPHNLSPIDRISCSRPVVSRYREPQVSLSFVPDHKRKRPGRGGHAVTRL